MSGGAFNFLASLCSDDIDELVRRSVTDGADMAAYARARGWTEAADLIAANTSELIAARDAVCEASNNFDALYGVMRAIEREASGDSGPEAVATAVHNYREENGGAA